MAFNLNQYISSGFQVARTPQAIREAAEAVNNDDFWGLVGNRSPLDWSRTALRDIGYYEEAAARLAAGEDPSTIVGQVGNQSQTLQQRAEELLDRAHGWITGAQQSTRARNVRRSYQENRQQARQELAELQANLANAPEQAASRAGELASWIQTAEMLDIEVPEPIRVASGFIPGTESMGGQREGRQDTPVSQQRAQQANRIAPQSDGTFAIVDADGNVFEGGFANEQAALARQGQYQSAGTPQLTGQPTVFGTTPVNDQERAAVESGQATVATPEQLTQVSASPEDTLVSQLEQAVSQAEGAATTENPSLVVTPEMRAAWLQEATDDLRNNRAVAEVIRNAEFDLGQSLNRLIEDVKFRELTTLNKFRTDFKNQQVSQRERGFLYGGIRQGEEKQLADTTNLGLAQEQRSLTRGIQDLSQRFERDFGTSPSQFGLRGAAAVAGDIGNVQGIARVIPGSPIIRAGEAQPGFMLTGGQFGNVNRDLTAEALRRAEEKQNAFETQFSLARTF